MIFYFIRIKYIHKCSIFEIFRDLDFWTVENQIEVRKSKVQYNSELNVRCEVNIETIQSKLLNLISTLLQLPGWEVVEHGDVTRSDYECVCRYAFCVVDKAGLDS